ncbi:MAG TPA: DNA repair protein RecN [Saprospiraceae bacterium]|nr:DNA repair protein RecN [Saprospiraceae bacterium]
MLSSIEIKNYAIIEHLFLEWKDGMSVITGETGAGKSILIGALQLVLGGRSDVKAVREGTQKCIVEARFNLDQKTLDIISEKCDIDVQNPLELRREISANGKSRSLINESLISASLLQDISNTMISIFQQFDLLDIVDAEHQLQIIDEYSGNKELLDEYKMEFKAWKQELQNLKNLEADRLTSLKEQEFILFQHNELSTLTISESEFQDLEEFIKAASKSEEIIQNSSQVAMIFSQDNGVIDKLTECTQLLKSIHIHKQVHEILERLEPLRMELREIGNELQNIAENSDFDPKTTQLAMDKVDQINRLMNKHHVSTIGELLQIKIDIAARIKNLDDFEDQRKDLLESIAKKESILSVNAAKLHSKRITASKKFAKNVESSCKSLGLEHNRFEIEVLNLSTLNESGNSSVQFLFTANKGKSVAPLKNQASGGELSRLNLSIRSILAQDKEMGTMVFDEIDTGVSGQIALQMGNILAELAKKIQLIAITHSPQVASRADQHLLVYKEHLKNETRTNIRLLNSVERIHEVAKMLSGDPPAKSALLNAQELLERT